MVRFDSLIKLALWHNHGTLYYVFNRWVVSGKMVYCQFDSNSVKSKLYMWIVIYVCDDWDEQYIDQR